MTNVSYHLAATVKCCPDCEKPNQFGELCREVWRD